MNLITKRQKDIEEVEKGCNFCAKINGKVKHYCQYCSGKLQTLKKILAEEKEEISSWKSYAESKICEIVEEREKHEEFVKRLKKSIDRKFINKILIEDVSIDIEERMKFIATDDVILKFSNLVDNLSIKEEKNGKINT